MVRCHFEKITVAVKLKMDWHGHHERMVVG